MTMDNTIKEENLPQLFNPGPALLFTALFGGVGLIRVSPIAGAFILIVDIVIYVLIYYSGPFALILLVPWRIVALLFAMTAIVRYNRLVLAIRERIQSEQVK